MANFKLGLESNIKLLRKVRNITQEELSEIVGIHSRQLSKIETGEHFPSCRTLEKLCFTLEVSPKDLFDFEYLVDESEGVLTGTDHSASFKVERIERVEKAEGRKNNVYQLRKDSSNQDLAPKFCSDESMAKTAKALNKPVFVEYFENKKTSKIVVFYPDGREKVIRNSVDIEVKQDMIYMMNEFKKISKDKNAVDFIKLAMASLKDDEALMEMASIVYGMKLARGLK